MFARDSKNACTLHTRVPTALQFSLVLIANGGKIRQVNATGGKCL